MRLSGRIDPSSGAGPSGQRAAAAAPRRTAARYETLSCAVRPEIRCACTAVVSAGLNVAAPAAPGGPVRFFATSPLAVRVDSPASDAFASGRALQAASATAPSIASGKGRDGIGPEPAKL